MIDPHCQRRQALDLFNPYIGCAVNPPQLEGDLVGRLSFYGQGAGGRPTADAVLQDLTSIRTRRVEPLPVAAPPVYDAGLLRGAGLTARGILPDRTLEELARAARETGEFMTFQPEP